MSVGASVGASVGGKYSRKTKKVSIGRSISSQWFW